jgi:hypothetical protein
MQDKICLEFKNKYEVVKNISEEKVRKLYGEDFNYFLANLLFSRGINNLEKSESFLNPK